MRHGHAAESFEAVASADAGGAAVQGTTTSEAHHQHTFEVAADGIGQTDLVMGHRDPVRKVGDGAGATYEIGQPEGLLAARVPRRGQLRFLDRSGKPGTGVNVGHEWMYRSYIEGGTLAAAIWTFDKMTADRYPDGFVLEKNLRVFRTHKGNIEQGVRGSLFVKNPNPSGRPGT